MLLEYILKESIIKKKYALKLKTNLIISASSSYKIIYILESNYNLILDFTYRLKKLKIFSNLYILVYKAALE